MQYKICAPIRLTLPLSGVLFTLPFIIEKLQTIYTIPLCYFIGSYFIFINFPFIAETLHSKPLYLEDLSVQGDTNIMEKKFQIIYRYTMNIILALLFASFADYAIIQGVRNKPIIEIIAIIGGNLSLYMKSQNFIGKGLINMCHYMKQREIKRKSSIEMVIL